MTEHPMQPSPEQFGEWLAEACRRWPSGRPGDIAGVVTRAAYAAGADAELEACCEWVQDYAGCGDSLRAARRPSPKPPSLKQQALRDLEVMTTVPPGMSPLAQETTERISRIRRALEALPND